MTTDPPGDGLPGKVTRTVRVGGYSLEPALGTGMRIQLLGARASFSHEIRQALAEPKEEPHEEVEEAIIEVERVTGWVEQASSLLKSALAGKVLDRAVVEGIAQVGLGLFERLVSAGDGERPPGGERRRRARGALRVSRVLVSLLLLIMRWRDLVGVLRTTLGVAGELQDLAAEAWAQHELGTIALAGGDLEQAAARLERARELRRQLGDEAGRAVTEANLRVLRAARPPWLKRLAVTSAAAIVIAVIAVVVALLLTRDDEPPTPPPPPGPVALSVALVGDGAGTVTSQPEGISCDGGTCSARFDADSEVVLEATAASGSGFTGWGGAGCSGTGDCSVTLDQKQSVTATFAVETEQVVLETETDGNGSGSVSPDCSGGCTHRVGDEVTLTATPTAPSSSSQLGSSFARWTECTPEDEPICHVTLTKNLKVTATFDINVD